MIIKSFAITTLPFILFLFLFPLNLPILDDRTYVCKEGGLNEFVHKLPPTYKLDRESGHVIFGDGQSGRVPNANSKHEETQGHIVFADANHAVVAGLCLTDPIPQ